jgi:hypothetical protein
MGMMKLIAALDEHNEANSLKLEKNLKMKYTD